MQNKEHNPARANKPRARTEVRALGKPLVMLEFQAYCRV